jgi:hypothetical protein
MLYNSILHWTNSDNIQPIGVFLEKPDKKTYPDYYEIISEPIDMNTIDSKINRNMYRSVRCCLGTILTDCVELIAPFWKILCNPQPRSHRNVSTCITERKKI